MVFPVATKKALRYGGPILLFGGLSVYFGDLGVVFIVVGLLLLLGLPSVAYTCGAVVTTLAAVEDTKQLGVLPNDVDADGPRTRNADLDAKAPAVAAVTDREELSIGHLPLTSSLRRTVKLLRRRGGFFAGLRGLHIYLFIHILSGFLTRRALPLVGDGFAASTLVSVAVNLLLARVHMLWTHMVISAPSPKRFWRRFAGRGAGRKILLPTLVSALAQSLLPVPTMLIRHFIVTPMWAQEPRESAVEARLIYAAYLLGVFMCASCYGLCAVIVGFPAQVVLARCQAALLPEDETPILRLDRSFGGRVVPEEEGGSGRLGVKDAWTSVGGRAEWQRIATVYVKNMGLLALGLLKFGLLMFFAFLAFPLEPEDLERARTLAGDL